MSTEICCLLEWRGCFGESNTRDTEKDDQNKKVVGVIKRKEKTEKKVLEFMRHDDRVSHV